MTINAGADFALVNDKIVESIAPKAMMAAVDLRLFDRVEGRSVGTEELGREMGLVPLRLEPLLEVLAALGLLSRDGGLYTNTPLASQYMVSTAELYQGDYLGMTMSFASAIEDDIARLLGGAEVDRAKADRTWSLEKGMEGTAQSARWGAADAVAEVAASLPGFEGFTAMCDIGGNHGLYSMGVLERNPGLRGVVYDLPDVAEQARRRWKKLGFEDRIEAVGMDFREETLPEGRYDLAITSHVLYAFKEDLAGALGRIADGLKDGGWFISHHYSGRCEPGGELHKASLELLTRLAGYASHFIDRDELSAALAEAGFEEPRFSAVPGRVTGLIAAARKR